MGSSLHYRTCNLCEAMCGLEIEHNNGEIISIKGDKNDPLSRGHICPKAVALKDIYYDKDRLKTPVKKHGDEWVSITWEQAFDEVHARLVQIQEKYGLDSVGVYQGNPNVHNMGTMLFGQGFIRSLKTKNRYSATSADQLPHHVASLEMFGHSMLIPIPDIDNTRFMLIIGANPLVSNGSMMSCPDYAKRMQSIRDRGGKVVVIDPRRTETAKKADEHIFIKPGRDPLLLLSLLNVIYNEELDTLDHLEDYTHGNSQLREICKEFTPEKVSELINLDADRIKKLAREFASSDSAVCYSRMGASTQLFGGLCQWLTNALNVVTGNLDARGGAMFTQPAFDLVGISAMQGRKGKFGRRKSRVSGLPSHGGEFPVVALREEIETDGEGQIKAMVTIAGNPLLSTPNGDKLEEAFKGLEFMVAIDIYINETTRMADIILPPTTGLETSHYDIIFNVLSVRNSAKYSPPLFDKAENQRHDYEILNELVARFNGVDKIELVPEDLLDSIIRGGFYKEKELNIQKLKEHPHGIDLGELAPCLTTRLLTDDKKINLVPQIFSDDIKRLKAHFMSSENGSDNGFPLQLIGRRDLRSNNSWMHNSERLVKGKNRCTLLLNQKDSDKYIKEGQEVKVSSRTGSVKIQVEITDEIAEGVVSIPHGWGHGKKGVKMEIASRNPGVSINDLTDEKLIDALTGNAAFNGVPVKVEHI